MIGITESGATKSDWFFTDGTQTFKIRTSGFNPYYQKEEEIQQILKEELLPQLTFKVDTLWFYGAGCEPQINRKKMTAAFSHFLPEAKIHINHDLYAAARALFGDDPGLVCIAGTGSNTCEYDGTNIVRNVNSLGLFMGDEGSGGYLGKLLIREYIREGLPKPLREKFEEKYTDRTEDIMQKVYGGKMPSKYLASYAPFLHENINDPFIESLVKESFENLFENCILKYENCRKLPLGFVGSIAYHFEEILQQIAKKKGLSVSVIDPSPSEALVNYHLKKAFS
ncbi:hypothetical protein RCC89_01775 [Cytophagaceae bacterium ABcell3]|nr:hypothetical protein RCC89_01775 [Cytophagaceae bacterium ABcell3]